MEGTKKAIVIAGLLIAVFLALGARCFHLQYNRKDHYLEASIRQQRSYTEYTPQRGVILDRRGRVLAASTRVPLIFADPKMIEDVEATSEQLAKILDIDAQRIARLINESTSRRYVKLFAGADPNQCSRATRLQGIGVQHQWHRNYPMGPLVAQPIGFTSADNRGIEGIELRFDSLLKGSKGSYVVYADVARRPIMLKEQHSTVVDGTGIVTTIDATIQQFARTALLEQYEESQAESAIAIVARPQTGEILAMVSLPDFHPGEILPGDMDNLRNRTITDEFEPGSVMKPIVVALALDAGVVNTNETIFCENGNYRGKGFGRIGEYRRGFGNLTVAEILIKSSNIGMAKLGQRLGKKRLHDGLKMFGFGEKTGIDLPGERTGTVRPLHKWDGYSETRVPFGQEITITGLQLVRAFCVLANGGRLVEPHIVKANIDNKGNVIKQCEPMPPVACLIKPEVAEWLVTEALSRVVNEGTGRRAKNDKWQLFGKTGTANIARPDGRGYSDNAYVASFICGAPAENPQIVVLVSVRKPNKKAGKPYTGGVVAAPVAGEIVDKTLKYLEKFNSVRH